MGLSTNQRRPPTAFYCGIDLSARTSQVCVIDEDISVLVQEKVPNELDCIADLIEPDKDSLQAVVESTFNWYWLDQRDWRRWISLSNDFSLYKRLLQQLVTSFPRKSIDHFDVTLYRIIARDLS